MAISISQLAFDHHRLPFGIGESEPRISWRFGGAAVNWEQTSYDLEIIRNGSSTRHSANSSQSLYVPWPETALSSGEQAQVRARAHGQSNQPSTPWSDWVTVETGLLDSTNWAGAVPITGDLDVDVDEPKRPIYFRKSFAVGTNITSARLYITALGLYEAEINGQPVGDHVLAPGWQSFNFRHAYDTYDVTDLLTTGDNAIGAVVGEGWYSGRLGYNGGERNVYGDHVGLLSLLVIHLDNGTTLRIPTDSSWRSSFGPILTSEIYDGEKYDSRLEEDIKGWSSASFDGSSWSGVDELPAPKGKLMAPDGPPVRRLEARNPQTISQSPSNKTIVDFGQNLVGWLRITVSGPAGTNITIRHAEVLQDGELATRPLRNASATDTILLHGRGEQTWEPKFTYHGFRYAEVNGWPGTLHADNLTAIVVHSDMEETGWFECSNPLLNQLHQNVRWSMRGNFLSIPTDCPQRDERLGWTGDAHIFGPTANILYNAAGFWRAWHRDVWSEMQRNGSMIPPAFIPVLPEGDWGYPTAVWGDVAVGNPWDLYTAYGDLGMLEEQYDEARAWIDTGVSRNDVGLWNRSTFQYGDWLDPAAPPEDPGNATTSAYLVADAYLIRMTELLANISTALNQPDLAAHYRTNHTQLTQAFQTAWITPNGTLANQTQTAYALALHFNLLPTSQRAAAATTLRQLIASNNHLVATGFAGTPVLPFALLDIDAADAFYAMLLQTQVPSWLYQVLMNATTTWERWDSLLPNATLNTGTMTSFNHYAFGAVVRWLYEAIAGIAPAEPGWRRVLVKPVPGGGLASARARFVSGYGEVGVRWWLEGEEGGKDWRRGFHLVVQVPPNSRATVVLPGSGEVKEVGSGVYEFFEPGVGVEGAVAGELGQAVVGRL